VTRARNLASASAYFLEKNRGRAVILFAALTILVLLNSAHAMVDALVGLIGFLPQFAIQLSFAVVFIGAQFFMMFYWLSRPRKYVVTPDDVQIGVNFDSYRGQPDLLDHARSTVTILKGVKEFELRGGEMPKGLLLSGGPGTGKTFLASCIASEAGLPFVYLDASSLQGAFVGTSQLMVMKLFRDARGLARKYAEPGKRGACIVFLDELDAIGMSRSGMQGGGMGLGLGGMMGGMGGGSQGLNALLNQMDSLTEHIEDRLRWKIIRWLGLVRGPVRNRPLIFVIGATNRPEVLDPALIRPGRLDRIIEVHPPDQDGRRDIIKFYLSKKAHDPDIDIELMITDSMEWTPIMIKTVINEALIVAHHDGREQLTYKDWLAAADERTEGIKQPIRSWHRDDRRKTAYHEAAHAVVARYALKESRISKATIIRRGHALGMVVPKPKEERTSHFRRTVESSIMVFLAGHAIETRYLKDLSTGPSSDLRGATQRAVWYVSQWAMGPTKLVVPLTNDLPPQPFVVAANELLDQLYAETERLLLQKMTAVHYVARALIERDELIGDELEDVFREAEAADPMLSRPFERKLIQFRSFMPRQAAAPTPEWQPGAGEAGTAAAAVAGETPAADADPWVLARAGEAAIGERDETDAWTWAPRVGGPDAPRVGGPDWLLEDGYQE
jgi:cell division protease FtsH